MTEKRDYVLIVDDQPGVRRLLFEALETEGYTLDVAANGLEALEKIRHELPDMMLLDMKMPLMNGLQVLQEVRKLAPDLPVVIMTAYGELDLVAETQALGVRRYLNKPFDIMELRNTVKAVLAGEAAAGGDFLPN